MDQRENDIQELCKQVLETAPHYSSSTGLTAKENSCPFCLEDGYWNEEMSDIKHDPNCAYLIAKDLSTGMNNAQAEKRRE